MKKNSKNLVRGKEIGPKNVAKHFSENNEEQFRKIFKNENYGISCSDRNTKFIKANRAFCKMIGYSEEELKKKSFSDITYPEYVKKNVEAAKKMIRGEMDFYRTEKRYIKKTGELVWVNLNVSRIDDKEGKFAYFLSMIENINDKKDIEITLKESEGMFKKLFEDSADPAMLLDNANFIDCNNATLKLFGYSSKKKIIGVSPWEISPKFQSDGSLSSKKAREMIEISKKNGYSRFEWEHKKADGSLIFVEVVLTVINFKKKKVLYVILRDISDRKKLEEQLILKNLVFDSSVSANSVGNIKGIIFDANPSFLKAWGFSKKKQVVGKSISYFFKDKNEAKKILKILDATGNWEGEFIAKKKDGSTFIAQCYATVVKDVNGKIVGYQSSINDITEKRKAEDDAIESKERFYKFFKSSPYATTITRMKDGVFLDVNDAFSSIIKYSRGEALASSSLKLNIWVNPKDRQEVVESLRAGKPIKNKEYLFITKEGIILNGLYSAQLLKLGKEPCIMSSIADITEQKKAEYDASVSELRYRRLFETAQDGVLLIDFETGMIIDVNQFLIDLLGYSKESFLNKHLWDVGFFKDVVASKKNFKTLQKKRYVRFEDLPLETRNGKKINVEFVANAYRVDGSTVIQCNIRNITDRKRAEKSLKRNELYLRSILNSTDDGILAVGNNGEIINVNKRFYKLWNIPKKIIEKNKDAILLKYAMKQLIEPEAFLSKVKKLYKAETTDLDIIKFRDGRVFERFTTPLILEREHIGRIWSFRNITQRLKDEQEIMEAKVKNEAILASIGDAVLACDKRGKILLFNKIAEEITGISAKRAIGLHYSKVVKFIREKDGRPSRDFIFDAIKKDRIAKMANHVLLIRRDGIKLPVADSAAPIKSANGETIGCVVVFRDATKERQVDKAKSEFVSLASHQLRTPSTAVNWYSEMLIGEEVGTLNKLQKEYLEEIHHGNQRMIEIVDSLLSISRIELGTFSNQPEPTEVSKVIEDVLEEFKIKINKKRLQIDKKYEKNKFTIKVDKKLFRIIFQNLISNAVDYTPAGGKISIEFEKKNGNFYTEVRDNGCGIPQKAKKDIFTKFFRAENANNIKADGTGLGLYITKSIVDALGGTIGFKSKENLGTVFSVTIPGRGMAKIEERKK